MKDNFKQKKINHIFHYSKSLDSIIGILDNGFAPSYCEERITDLTYLIPMVSFCNIPMRDVSLYMRYGNYGIGMSIDWAIKNKISPVIYIHENSPFNNLHKSINEVLLFDMLNLQLAEFQQQVLDAADRGEEYKYTPQEDDRYTKLISEINRLTVPALQFFKNWKVQYQGDDIITYQEREWRYIPEMTDYKKIIPSKDEEFAIYSDKDAKPKPHLPEYALPIETIADIRYIIINSEDERSRLIQCLNEKFGKESVLDALFSGTFVILTDQQVKNDF